MPKRLSARLEAVASLVPKGCYLADIGSDHAFLPIALVERGVISYAQAIDNKMGPFLRMEGHVKEAGLSSHIKTLCSDGLTDIGDEVNALSICGIGGLLTVKLLQRDQAKLTNVDTIIVDPHRDLVAVRKQVSEMGYHIVAEKMVYENKIFYCIIRFDKGAPVKPYDALDLYFGPIARKEKSPVYLEWVADSKKKVSSQLNKNLPPERKEYYLKLYRALSKQLKESEGK